MSSLVTRAQLMLLAQLLHVKVAEVQHLERLGPDALYAIRTQVSARIFDANADVFKVISMLVPVVPLRIALPIVQRIVPPEMAGRAAGALATAHPKKIAHAMPMLKPPYAAAAAPYMDPRAVEKVAHLAPPKPVVDIANAVLARGDYTTAGLFVEYATRELILAVVDGVHDDEAIVRSGAYVYQTSVLNQILELLLDEATHRIDRMINTIAAGPTDLRLAGLSILERIEPGLMARAGDVLFRVVSPDALADLLRTFVAEGVLADLFQFVEHLTPFALDSMAANPLAADPEFQKAAIETAADYPDDSVWEALIDLAARTPVDVQASVLEQILDGGNHIPQRAAAVAREQPHLWVPLAHMFANQDANLRRRVVDEWTQWITLAELDILTDVVRQEGLEDRLEPDLKRARKRVGK